MGASQENSHEDGQALPTSIEICAGAGGQAVGLHRAGFQHLALIEYDHNAVSTLRKNAAKWPGWDQEKISSLHPMDVKEFLKSGLPEKLGIKQGELSLLAGGVPCPPFSLAGKQLGEDDERDLFPEMLNIVKSLRPKAVMIENVRGILEPPGVFIDYRRKIVHRLGKLGYDVPRVDPSWSDTDQDRAMQKVWRRLDAKDFGVPQLRPRAILVAIRKDIAEDNEFIWPKCISGETKSAYDTLLESMSARFAPYLQDGSISQRRAREAFERWQDRAEKAKSNGTDGVAPTLVGGSRKHGGADLGPTRAKKAWKLLGVDGNGVANDPGSCDPERDLFRPDGPMLTVSQAAAIQGFPEEWEFQGGKTARYRQVGNAFPPPVAAAVGRAIMATLYPARRNELMQGYQMDTSPPGLVESIPLNPPLWSDATELGS